MYVKNQRVKALIDLMSDDRALGIDDGTPIIRAGTIGRVIEKSTNKDNTMKIGCENCWVVDWGVIKFDTDEKEMIESSET